MTELRLGTMTFGGRTPRAEADRIVRRALELGVTVFDTANMYENGAAEEILGAALGADRERVEVASKVGAWRKGRAAEGLSRARVREACDESLRRLRTDHLDTYFLHVPDPRTPIEETLGAFAELYEEKKILGWAVSNYASWQILELVQAAQKLGLPPPRRAQMLYNVLVRQLDVEYFAFAERYALSTEVYNPLAGGLLTPRHPSPSADKRGSRFDKNGMYERRYWSDVMFARRDELARAAEEAGIGIVELSYRFLVERRGVAAVLVGAGTLAHLDAAHAALATALPPDLVARLEKMHVAWNGTDARYGR